MKIQQTTRLWQDFTWHNMQSLRSSALGDPAEQHWFAACLATVEGKPSLETEQKLSWNCEWTNVDVVSERVPCRFECHQFLSSFPRSRFGSKLQQLLHQLTCNSPDLSILFPHKHPLTLSIFLFTSLLPADIPAWLCMERKWKSAVCYVPLTLSFVLPILGDAKEYSSSTDAAEFHLSGWRQKFTVLPYLHSGHVFGIGTFWVQRVFLC